MRPRALLRKQMDAQALGIVTSPFRQFLDGKPGGAGLRFEIDRARKRWGSRPLPSAKESEPARGRGRLEAGAALRRWGSRPPLSANTPSLLSRSGGVTLWGRARSPIPPYRHGGNGEANAGDPERGRFPCSRYGKIPGLAENRSAVRGLVL